MPPAAAAAENAPPPAAAAARNGSLKSHPSDVRTLDDLVALAEAEIPGKGLGAVLRANAADLAETLGGELAYAGAAVRRAARSSKPIADLYRYVIATARSMLARGQVPVEAIGHTPAAATVPTGKHRATAAEIRAAREAFEARRAAERAALAEEEASE